MTHSQMRVPVGLAMLMLSSCAAQPVERERHTQAEDIAIYMMKLGGLRWERACAFEIGREGKLTREQMEKKCSYTTGVKDERGRDAR